METSTAVTTPSHGVKRQADDNLESEQRLSKRFNLLNLNRNGKLWMPPPDHRPPPMRRSSNDMPEFMDVEDSKHKVYVRDLDAELAEVSREEQEVAKERLIFLPDIEKHLNKLYPHVLRASEEHHEPQGNEVVLYNVPSSLSVTEENDGVRKAIIEARARARQKQAEDVRASRDAMLHDDHETNVEITNPVLHKRGHDPDAMDIG